ncbi:GH116 family glycosyl-hydrolase [Bauldia sp.]|uniref:GH116 family glycosyl-hydrolase n=1 Tax=Bauldia sp. TaxID=2575872 RepID=UPI003BAC30F1
MTRDYFRYDSKQAPHAVFPLGGIGAGGIGIGADGRLQDWEIFNRPSKGSVNGFSHFAVRAERDGSVVDTRILHGPFTGNRSGVLHGKQFNTFGFGPRREEMTGFPHFAESSLTGPYPMATLVFADQRFPGPVTMRASSPFVPMEDRLSSLPVAQFEVTFENTGDADLDYTLFGCIAFEFGGAVVDVSTNGSLTISGRADCDAGSVDYAEIALATDHPETSYQRHLFRGSWFDTMEVYWADIARGGPLKDRYYGDANHVSAPHRGPHIEHSVLAAHVNVPAGETRTVRVAIGWYVPNVKKTWVSRFALLDEKQTVKPVWKNFYATQWDSASACLAEVFAQWDDLTTRTSAFRDSLTSSTLPITVVDAVSANLSILKSPTSLRLEDGTFYGWEGCHPDAGCCEGSCTHVWNYQQVLPFLFPALERSMREADFFENQVPETGGMAFRMALPKGVGTNAERPCADGQFGGVLKAYRDWKLSGNNDWLRSIWPNVAAAIEYAWNDGNYDKWDPEKTGVLHGRQHHTLDMELFGPNAWLTGFYLGALMAGAEMAETMGEADRAALYRDILRRGKAWVTENLFNGDYFIQKIDLKDKSSLEPFNFATGTTGHVVGNIFDQYWSDELGEIKYQILEGCGIDQVLAQWHASLYGLGDIFDPDQFASAVRAIYRNNYKPRLGDVPNPCRVFGMEDEAGTVICDWPEGASRPAIPVPYSQETMHGFEYAFGCELMMIGEIDKGAAVFAGVRDRYRGGNRNPWNEIECGSNYARSMASYAAIVVLSGFAFDGVKGEMAFAPQVQSAGQFRSFWSNGAAWGTVAIGGGAAEIAVLGGLLTLTRLDLCGRTYGQDELAALDGAAGGDGGTEFKAGRVLAFSAPELEVTGLQDIGASIN